MIALVLLTVLGGAGFQRTVLRAADSPADTITAAAGADSPMAVVTAAANAFGRRVINPSPVPVGSVTPRTGHPSGRPSTTGAPAASATTAPAAAAGSPLAPAAAAGDPFAGARFYIDPDNQAAADADSLRASDPSAAAALQRVANGSHAVWFGYQDPGATQQAVAARVALIRAAGALPVLVAYGIPDRDCGGFSAGGAPDAGSYRAWTAAFAAGLSGGPAAVILEPDALAETDCLSSADVQTRYGLLANAVNVLAAAGASVYLDAGNAGWHPAADMASRLSAAGVGRARGFALNVSNFGTTAAETAYGDAIVAAIGGQAHFVVDTSRNGLGPAPDNAWCNPPGRALGTTATAATGDSHADALYWIKIPGESDGTCNGGPAAGQWWRDYAVGLGSRAA
jgi:endoglucanase